MTHRPHCGASLFAAAMCLAAVMACSPLPKREPTLDEKVQALIGRIDSAQDEKEQAAASMELEKLGRPAVPYIIKRMDNRSMDALAAILNRMTGQNFGLSYSGGSGATRSMAIAGWRAWCRTTFPDTIDGCFP